MCILFFFFFANFEQHAHFNPALHKICSDATSVLEVGHSLIKGLVSNVLGHSNLHFKRRPIMLIQNVKNYMYYIIM